VTPLFFLFGKNKPAQARNSENTGKSGEDIAASFLRSRGYAILLRNYRKRFGEIDIIAEIDATLVFVEVKTRTSTFSGRPIEAVDYRKQARMIKAAMNYITSHRLLDRPARFDVIGVLLSPARAPEIEHIVNAFDLDG
jgi:putative endonuclease